MSRALDILEAGPGLTVQDLGRPGYLASGLARGGAADRRAIHEGAALLGQDQGLAALEMAGLGGVFTARQPLRIALSGAPMQARLDGRDLAWNASHDLLPGQRLSIGGARSGVYGYLHLGGGIATERFLGSRSVHLLSAIGAALAAGDSLPVGPDTTARFGTGKCLDILPRFKGGAVRIVPSAQTSLFAKTERDRFEATAFARDPRGNRQGVRLAYDGAPFAIADQLNILSEIIVPGDIQMTGDGAPYVLLPECQVTGGYPRIGTVLPCDLPIVAQAAPGTALRFRFVSLEEGLTAEAQSRATEARLGRELRRLVRDPRLMADLLGYQLISGVVSGQD